MQDFSLASPDEFYKAAEESKKKISEKIAKIKQLSDIVNITLHNSLKNFEDIGHWNKYPRSVAKWIFIPMRRAGR